MIPLVGIYHGSVLSVLLFIIVLEPMPNEFSDDGILISESEPLEEPSAKTWKVEHVKEFRLNKTLVATAFYLQVRSYALATAVPIPCALRLFNSFSPY